MTGLVRECLVRASRISIVGITMGGIAAIASLLAAPAVEAVAAVIRGLFWTLAVLPTATLLVMSLNDVQASETTWYRPAGAAYSLLIAANLIGAILAMLFFFVLVTNAPAVLRGLDANTLRQAVVQAIGWTGPVIALAAAALGALGVGAWVRQRMMV